MRCLVTGATGHLGSFLTRRLVADGHDVAIMIRPESDLSTLGEAAARVHQIRGDLSNPASVAKDIEAFAAETVFHLAWFGVTSELRNDERQIIVNVNGTLEILAAARRGRCTTFVGFGSQAEYGRVDGVLREELVPKPVTLYGAAKYATAILTERLCETAGVRWLWFRLLASYGPADSEKHLIPSVIRQLLEGQKPPLTAGEQQWDYLYVEDAVEAICAAAFDPAVRGVFNLASGTATRLRDLVQQLRDLVDPHLPLGFGEVDYRPDQIMHLEGDISRLAVATGWRPRTTIADGLRKTVDWYRDRHPLTTPLARRPS